MTDDMTTAYMVGYEAGKAEARASLDVLLEAEIEQLEAEMERLRAALTTLGDVDYFAGAMQWDGWKVATRMRDFALAALEEPTP